MRRLTRKENIETQTLGDKQQIVNAEEMLEALDYMIPDVEAETACDTLNDVQAEKVLNGQTDTVADEKPKKRSEHWLIIRPRHQSMLWPTG